MSQPVPLALRTPKRHLQSKNAKSALPSPEGEEKHKTAKKKPGVV